MGGLLVTSGADDQAYPGVGCTGHAAIQHARAAGGLTKPDRQPNAVLILMPTPVNHLLRFFYPGEKWDGTAAFYRWVRQDLGPSTALLNLGAGPATGSPVRSFRGEVARVVGADIDGAVLENDELDEAHVTDGTSLPFPDESFDVVLSDYVLEHVEHPMAFLREVRRVLKPRGCFLFRTPNRLHYVSLVAQATPHWFHELVANRVRGLPSDAHEPWPTYHRLNTCRAIRTAARRAGFSRSDFRMVEFEPSYLVFHAVPFAFGVAYERVVNSTNLFAPLRANIFGRLER